MPKLESRLPILDRRSWTVLAPLAPLLSPALNPPLLPSGNHWRPLLSPLLPPPRTTSGFPMTCNILTKARSTNVDLFVDDGDTHTPQSVSPFSTAHRHSYRSTPTRTARSARSTCQVTPSSHAHNRPPRRLSHRDHPNPTQRLHTVEHDVRPLSPYAGPGRFLASTIATTTSQRTFSRRCKNSSSELRVDR